MRVEQLNEGMWAMTYLVVCDSTKKATLIDPVWDNLSDYLSLLEDQGLELEYAMATHTHADHITGCFKLAEMTGCEYVMWNDTPSLGVTIYVDEESSISMGDVDFHYHYAPGHTGDSMIIECGDYIFTGDFLVGATVQHDRIFTIGRNLNISVTGRPIIDFHQVGYDTSTQQ